MDGHYLSISIPRCRPEAALGSYSLNVDLSRVLADAGGSEDEAETLPLDERAMERLTAENARLEGVATQAFPEHPCHLVLLIVVAVGNLVGILLLLR
jgi:hypothetical protein